MNPVSTGYWNNTRNVPNGFALFQSNALRFSVFKDSGKIKYPNKKFEKAKKAAPKKGILDLNFPIKRQVRDL